MTETSVENASPETENAAVEGEEQVENTEETTEVSEGTEEISEEEQAQEETKSFEDMMNEALKNEPRIIKVNGREKKITSYAEWQKYASLGAASSERFEEAKRMREEAEEIRKIVEDGDVLQILKRKGLQGDELKSALAQVVENLLEEEQLDPRDRELRELKAEKEARIRAEKEAKEEAERESYQKQVQAEAEKFVNDIYTAAEEFGLPAEPFLVQNVASELEASFDAGVQMDVKDAVKLVRDRFMEDYTTYVKALPVDVLKQVLGDDIVKALQSDAVKAAKAAEKPFDTPKRDSSKASDTESVEDMVLGRRKKPKEEEKLSQKEFFRKLQLGEI